MLFKWTEIDVHVWLAFFFVIIPDDLGVWRPFPHFVDAVRVCCLCDQGPHSTCGFEVLNAGMQVDETKADGLMHGGWGCCA